MTARGVPEPFRLSFLFKGCNVEAKPASQQDHGKCRWCAGTGLVKSQTGQNKCPKCGGSGKAPKITTK